MTCLLARGPQGKSGGELLFWSTAAGLMNNVVLAKDLAQTVEARSFASTLGMTVAVRCGEHRRLRLTYSAAGGAASALTCPTYARTSSFRSRPRAFMYRAKPKIGRSGPH